MKIIVVFRLSDRPYILPPTLSFLKAFDSSLSSKMRKGVKVVVLLSFLLEYSKLKEIPTYLPYFFQVMIPERNYFFVFIFRDNILNDTRVADNSKTYRKRIFFLSSRNGSILQNIHSGHK